MKNRQNIQMSVFDRLLDYEPGVSREPATNRFLSIELVRASIVRDLENLLNSRRTITDVPPVFKEVNKSLFTYGISDFTSENPKSRTVRRKLQQDVEKAIALFEPRLSNVTVHLEISTGKSVQSLRFKISGMLITESESEPVAFDTFFDINRGEYRIQK